MALSTAGNGEEKIKSPAHATNIREIARAAGVSIATVSRALQDPPSDKVSSRQREEIRRLCERLHYVPNVHTRRMFQQRSHTVAFCFRLTPLLEQNPASANTDLNFSASMMGAQRVLAARGFDLLLCEINPAFLAARRHLAMVRSRQVDGILVWGPCDRDDYLRELVAERAPVVQISGELPDSPCSSVVADEYGGMSEIAEQAIAAGHRRISLLKPPPDNSVGRERFRAVVERLANHGLVPRHVSTEQGFGYEFGRRAIVEILAAAPDTTCVIAPDDMAAWACIDEFADRGIDVPGDISVTGADGLYFPGRKQVMSYLRPSAEIGATGARLLLAALDGDREIRRTVLPPQPVRGNTLAAPATPDELPIPG